MQRISSDLTFFYKRVFPFMIFPAVIASMVITAAKAGADLSSFLVMAFVPIIGYAGMKLTGLFDLVDEVLDAGDALIVRNGDREERVLLSDIIDVRYAYMWGQFPRVSLVLRTPCQFGDQITFACPGPSLMGSGQVPSSRS